MKKKFLLICLAAIMFFTGKAQVSEFDYQISFPTGEFKDFISKTNYVGFSGQYRHILNNKQWSVGGSFTWFYLQDKKGHITQTEEPTTVTGNINNYTNIYALLAVLQYDFKSSGRATPFARIGLGGAYQDQRKDAGIWVFQNDGVQFASNAEFGFRFSPDKYRGLILAATYHYLPETDDVRGTSFFGIKIGISNMKW